MAAPISSARPLGPSSRFASFDDLHANGSHDRSPHPNSRSRAATLSDRPQTSSGPESRKARVKYEVNHQTSRDDTHVAAMVATRTNYKSYHVPIRGNAPSPDSSPNSRTQSPPMTTVVRTTTPDSLTESSSSEIIAIGMALGSPSQPPESAATSWRPQKVTRAMTASAAVPEPEPEPQKAKDETPTKAKSRKWGFFGRSKSKRGRSTTSSAPSPASTTQEQFGRPLPPPADFMRQRGPEITSPLAKHKPLVVRSQTAPLMGEGTGSRKTQPDGYPSYTTSQTARKPLPNQPAAEGRRPVPPSKAPVPFQKEQLLKVEIPSIEMERYSIMFGSVLQPSNGSSSLLARRQATLEKLRMLKDSTTREEEELALKPPPRRATSPNPGRNSPSFSLFPPTPGKAGTPQRISPRGRSYTSPALLPSPSQPNFDPQEAEIFLQRSATPTGARKPDIAHRHVTESARADSARDSPRPRKARSSSKLRAPQVVVESPKSIGEGPESHIEGKLLPALQEREPSWQMVSQSPLPSTASTRTTETATPTSSSTPTISYDAKRKAEEEAQKALRDAVQSSIRRQISMSQQQRQMLRPQHINPSPIRKDASPQGVGIAKNIPRVVVGQNERLAETKSSTPTLVHPGHHGQSPLTNRKSERIVFDSA